jgi:glycolate oxidase
MRKARTQGERVAELRARPRTTHGAVKPSPEAEASPCGDLADTLRAIVGQKNVLDKLVELQTYEYDAYLERSVPCAVVFVETTDQVSRVLKVLADEGIPFVPRGCGTNLSGGSLALDGAVVLEMSRMNKVLEIDIPNQRMTVQVGIFNLDISTILSPFGYYYAPDPASQKACSLGGNIAENAGGPHCFKYGVTSNHVLGVEVVLAGGEIVWLGGKDADPFGLDLTGTFVGSEGTLGIATTAILRILRKPEAVKTLLAVCDSLEDGGNVVSAIVAAGLMPATLEMVDNRTINAIEDSMACGFPREAAAVLLIELDGLRDGMEEMSEAITSLCTASGVPEVRVAKDEAERQALWRGRKGAFGSISRLAPNYMVADGTVPRTKLPEALRRVGEIGCRYDIRIASVFHAGDGNLHPLLLFDSRDPADRAKVMAAGMEVLKVCAELGGTVSGEHGIGVEKLAALPLVFTDDDLRAQGLVKDAFDPSGLANPGKLLRRTGAGAGAGGDSGAAQAARAEVPAGA